MFVGSAWLDDQVSLTVEMVHAWQALTDQEVARVVGALYVMGDDMLRLVHLVAPERSSYRLRTYPFEIGTAPRSQLLQTCFFLKTNALRQ